MKFPVALLASFLGASSAITHNADIYYHEKQEIGPAMWIFNPDGLTIMSPAGETILVQEKSKVCPNLRTNYQGVETDDCSFFDVQSDGHRYVWAANHDDSPHKIDVFDINTGEYAGYAPTCSTPLDLNYHPLRQEMWVRCASKSEDSNGEVDVFSTNSLSSNHELVNFNATGSRAYGRMETHSTMGNVGYATTYNSPYLTKFDLSGKDVMTEFEIEKAHASYDSTFSHANRHVFAAVRVCCTCGFEGADVESCGRGSGSPVLVTTGPSASNEMQNGTCSSGCKGSAADTIGVVEFDTVKEVFVGNHNSVAGNGGVPKSAPDGKTIALLPFDGGATLRVLKTGQNGAESSVAADIPVDFQGGTPGKQAISDLAWVQDGSRNFIVVASNVDNSLVVADMDDGYRMVKIPLSNNEEATAAGNRQVEWAIGTNYVWVNGGQTEEVYIVEIGDSIDDTKVVKTLQGVPDGKILYVKNYEREAQVQDMLSLLAEQQQEQQPQVTVTAAPAETSAVELRQEFSAAMDDLQGLNEDSNTETLAIAGLAVGCVALTWAVVATVYFTMMKEDSKPSPAPLASQSLDVETAKPAVANGAKEQALPVESDAVTLGSKQVA